MKTKKVFSVFLAKDLCELGHKIIKLEYLKNENKQVFVFEVSGEFEKDFKTLSLSHKSKTKIK